MTDTTTVRPIRLDRLLNELSPNDALTAVAVAIEELGMAQALCIVHGRDRGVKRFVEAGGHIRFDDDGKPVILWTSALAERAGSGVSKAAT